MKLFQVISYNEKKSPKLFSSQGVFLINTEYFSLTTQALRLRED